MGDGASAAQIQKIGWRTPISAMHGIRSKRAEALEAKGIRVVEDLIFHLPAHYGLKFPERGADEMTSFFAGDWSG